MAEKNRKAKAGGPRTEVFAMRLDPKLKYLAEIAARKQRRSLANFIEWSLERALGAVKLAESEESSGQYHRSVLDEANRLWDLEPSDRLIKLAENFPDLLTYEEQRIWKAILEMKAYSFSTDDSGKNQTIVYDFVEDFSEGKKAEPIAVKECWTELVAYSEGNASEEDVQAALKKTLNF